LSKDLKKATEKGENLEKIKDMTERLNEVVTHPEFINIIHKIESTPLGERMEFVSKHVTPTALTEKGIPMPEGFRITTRVFDDPGITAAQYTEDKDVMVPTRGRPPRVGGSGGTTLCASLGFFLCVSIGTSL
jgi:hypothetical protein